MLSPELQPAAHQAQAMPGPVPAVTSLAQLAVGRPARVFSVQLWDSQGDRLAELGLTPGAPIAVLRRGLLGGPIQVRVRDFALSLNRAQATAVQVCMEALGG